MAGRLTKPPRGGRWRACPSADAKAVGFVKRPSEPRAFGLEEPAGRTPDLRVQDQPGGKRDLGQRVATGGEELRLGSVGQDRVSARELRIGGPRISVHGPPGGTEASAEDLAGCETEASASGIAKAGSGTQVPNSPSGEPPGLRPWSGSQRGNWKPVEKRKKWNKEAEEHKEGVGNKKTQKSTKTNREGNEEE